MAIERLIVGLGNPGDEYRGTRHNVGFEVIERVARLLNVRLERFRARGDSGKSLGHGCEDSTRGFALLEPSTYMNVSGVAVAAARDRYELNSPSILIICDDFHLPLGRIRVRPKGSAGGHNGLRSIIAMLGTDEFPRVRVGIGESPGPWQEFVLSRFARDERPVIERTISDSTDAIAAWCLSGDFDRLMNKLNAPPASQDPLQS